MRKNCSKCRHNSAYHIKTKYENIEIGLSVYIWCDVWELFLFFSLTACQGYMHGFTKSLKLEAVNPNDPSSICAALVTKIPSKFFFQVEIDSMITCSDSNRPAMWCTSNSRNIFPVGWCAQNNIQLTPPPGMEFFNTAHLISMFVFAVRTLVVMSLNPLHPNIIMHNLPTVVYTFPKVLTRRICLTIKSFFSGQSLPLLSLL